MSTTNPEFPQELIESWRDAYDLNDQDIDDIQKKWQTVIKEGLPQKSFLEKSEQNFKKRNQRVQASKDEICEFVKLHYPLDEAFLKALDQKWAELADKFDHEKLGKLSDHFTETTSIVNLRQHYLQRYEQKVCELAQQRQSFQFSPDDRASLKDLQQELDIADGIADRIERDLKRQKYHNLVSQQIQQTGKHPDNAWVEALLMGCGLAKSDVQDIDQELLAGLSPARSQPPVQQVTTTSRDLTPQPVVPPKPKLPPKSPSKPSPKSPLWMYGAVGACVAVLSLAAMGLALLPHIKSQAPTSPTSFAPSPSRNPGSTATGVINQIYADLVADARQWLTQKSLTDQQLIDIIKRLSQLPTEGSHVKDAQALTKIACTRLQTSVMSQFNEGKFSKVDAFDAFVKQAIPCTQLQAEGKKSAKLWQQNTKYLADADKKLKAKDYSGAIAEARKVSGNQFQLQEATTIIYEAEAKLPKSSYSDSSGSGTSSSGSDFSGSDSSDSGTSSSGSGTFSSGSGTSSSGDSGGAPGAGVEN